MAEREDLLGRAVRILQEPVEVNPDLDRRVMQEVQSLPAPGGRATPVHGIWEWLRRGRTVRVSPLGGLALAAGIAALVVITRQLSVGVTERQPQLAATSDQPQVQFVIVAPDARTVSLVGDFNDWSVSATPLRVSSGNGIWSVTIPLEPGRYRYGFVVNENRWVTDPSAPPALEDEFGRPSSVVTVGGL